MGIQRLEPGKAVLGSRVRQLLLPAFQGWVQLIAPHHRRAELLHTHPMGTSLPWQLGFQGRQGAAPCKAVWGGQDRAHLHRITPGSGNDQVPPVQLDLSLWQAMGEDLQGKMGDLTKRAVGSCSWVT